MHIAQCLQHCLVLFDINLKVLTAKLSCLCYLFREMVHKYELLAPEQVQAIKILPQNTHQIFEFVLNRVS